MEKLPQTNEEQSGLSPKVGESIFVRRSDGRIYTMTIIDISTESYATFDEQNQPVDDRSVTVRGSSPDIINGELAYPQKIIPARMASSEYQTTLQSELMEKMTAGYRQVQQHMGEVAATNAISSPVCRIPHTE